MAPYMNQEDVQPTARTVLDVAKQIILNGYAEAWVEEWGEKLSERSTEEFMTHAKMLMKQRCQHKNSLW